MGEGQLSEEVLADAESFLITVLSKFETYNSLTGLPFLIVFLLALVIYAIQTAIGQSRALLILFGFVSVIFLGWSSIFYLYHLLVILVTLYRRIANLGGTGTYSSVNGRYEMYDGHEIVAEVKKRNMILFTQGVIAAIFFLIYSIIMGVIFQMNYDKVILDAIGQIFYSPTVSSLLSVSAFFGPNMARALSQIGVQNMKFLVIATPAIIAIIIFARSITTSFERMRRRNLNGEETELSDEMRGYYRISKRLLTHIRDGKLENYKEEIVGNCLVAVVHTVLYGFLVVSMLIDYL